MAASTERAFVATPIPSAGVRVIAAPFQFWTSGEDALRVTTVCSMANVRLKIQGRFVGPDGVITAASWDHLPRSDRIAASDEYPLGVGAVLNLVVLAVGVTPFIGQVFVIVQLIRGRGAAATVLGVLLQGYITSTQALAWPGSPIENSLTATAVVRTLIGTTPAAGQEFTEFVPTNTRWQLLRCRTELTTNATVAARRTFLQLWTNSTNDAQYAPAGSQPASTTFAYEWAPNLPFSYDATYGIVQQAIGDAAYLLAGQAFRSVTPNLQPGDQYGSPGYTVREWLEVR